MKNKPEYYSSIEINSIFARLDPRDVEQFYRNYHLWTLQQQIAGLQRQITDLGQQIAENNERMQQVQPSAIALATLARLQSNGVNDINLLDRMLERGEAWLDQTMQRLAYCEKFDFIRNNYTEWCENSLDGAYDWIDSLQEVGALSPPDKALLTNPSLEEVDDSLKEATEEILLQKLMSEEEDEDSLLESTLPRPVVLPATEAADPVPEEVFPIEISDIPGISHDALEQVTPSEQVKAEPTSAELGEVPPAGTRDSLTAPEVSLPVANDEPMPADEPALSEENGLSDQVVNQVSPQQVNYRVSPVTITRQKRSFLLRLLAIFFRK